MYEEEDQDERSNGLSVDHIIAFYRPGQIRLHLETKRIMRVDLVVWDACLERRVIRTTDVLNGVVDTVDPRLLSEPMSEMEALAWAARS